MRARLEEREERQSHRIKVLLRHYHRHAGGLGQGRVRARANRRYPFVFARAWQELKSERVAGEEAPIEPGEPPVPEIDETIYPLDPAQRELVLEIERVRDELEADLAELKTRGAADDILLTTCAKILYRAHESLTQQAETWDALRLETPRDDSDQSGEDLPAGEGAAQSAGVAESSGEGASSGAVARASLRLYRTSGASFVNLIPSKP